MWNLILAECLEHQITDKFQSYHILEARARWSCKSLEAPQPKILPLLVLGNYNVDSLDDRIKWIYPSGHENKTSRGVNCSNSLWVNVVSPVTVWSQHVTLELGWFASFSVVSWTLLGISESWTLLGKVCCSQVYQCLKDFLLEKKTADMQLFLGHLHLFNKCCQAKKAFIIHILELKFYAHICKGKIKHAVQC